jgi:hypothetical protein
MSSYTLYNDLSSANFCIFNDLRVFVNDLILCYFRLFLPDYRLSELNMQLYIELMMLKHFKWQESYS